MVMKRFLFRVWGLRTRALCLTLATVATLCMCGCIATRSEIVGRFDQPAAKNLGAEKVSVFFHFRNLAQQHGFDSIPKLNAYGVKDSTTFSEMRCRN